MFLLRWPDPGALVGAPPSSDLFRSRLSIDPVIHQKWRRLHAPIVNNNISQGQNTI
jgi:hypothetical protein